MSGNSNNEKVTSEEKSRLLELAQLVTPGPYFADGYDVQDDADSCIARCNGGLNDLQEDTQESFTHFIAAACNLAPRLVRELEAAEASVRVLEKELRGTGNVLVERLDRAGSWGVLVDAGALQALEARVKSSIESDDALDAYVHGTTQKFMQAVTGSLDADLQQEKEEKEGAK